MSIFFYLYFSRKKRTDDVLPRIPVVDYDAVDFSLFVPVFPGAGTDKDFLPSVRLDVKNMLTHVRLLCPLWRAAVKKKPHCCGAAGKKKGPPKRACPSFACGRGRGPMR